MSPPEQGKPQDPEPLRWRLRRGSGRPIQILVIFTVASLGAAAGFIFFQSWFMGMLGFAMILTSTADYWLGATYLVDSKGARSRIGLSISAMEWSEVKRVVVEPRAIRISPLVTTSGMDPFRGVLLRVKESQHEEVLLRIKKSVSAEVPFDTVGQGSS